MPMPPRLTIFCGPNGSGKTTLTRKIRAEGYDLGVYINPDDIAATLDGTMAERTVAAQAQAEIERERCLIAGIDFSFETVFSHPSKLDFMDRAAAAGYEIHVFFVSLPSPDMNIERVRLRVRSGGHDVPPERITARWIRTMDQLEEIVRRADRVVIFDNGSPPEAPVIRPVAWTRMDVEDEIVIERERDAPAWVAKYLPRIRLPRAKKPTRG